MKRPSKETDEYGGLISEMETMWIRKEEWPAVTRTILVLDEGWMGGGKGLSNVEWRAEGTALQSISIRIVAGENFPRIDPNCGSAR